MYEEVEVTLKVFEIVNKAYRQLGSLQYRTNHLKR